MANNRQKDKIGDEIPTKNGKYVNPNMEKDGCNEKIQDQNHDKKDVGQEGDVPKKSDQSGYYNEDNLQVWKDRCQRRNEEVKEMANKLADLQSVVNFMMQNNVMQPLFLLQDTPIPTANARKGGQKTILVAPQHTKSEKHSHQPSRKIGREGKNLEGHIAPRRQTLKNIGMFKGKSYASIQLMKKGRKGLTTKPRVVHRKD
ncbi:hypothetical protein CsSME_00003323 [Camellia sinensis var. sinensis]